MRRSVGPLKTSMPERLEEFYEMLAYHYSKSENLPKAYEYLKKAAGKAVQKDALFEGLRLYKEAMWVLLKLPSTAENQKEQVALILLMAAPERGQVLRGIISLCFKKPKPWPKSWKTSGVDLRYEVY